MFLEWLSIDNGAYYLKLTFKAKRKEKSNSISEIFYDIKAGEDKESGVMSGEARNKLKATYLKLLRDGNTIYKHPLPLSILYPNQLLGVLDYIFADCVRTAERFGMYD